MNDALHHHSTGNTAALTTGTDYRHMFPADADTIAVLQQCRRQWLNARQMRQKRARFQRYTYGRQWDDLVTDSHGHPCTEHELATRSGQRPLTNNLIRRLTKTVIGQLRSAYDVQYRLDNTLSDSNRLPELDSRAFEEFIISGCAVQRIVAERRMQGDSTWVDNVNPARFFVNTLSDPRCWDVEIIGMLHDMNLPEVAMRFAAGDCNRARQLQKMLVEERLAPLAPDASLFDDSTADFYHAPQGKYRIIEAWTLDVVEQLRCHDRATGQYFIVPAATAGEIEAENADRIAFARPLIDTRWEMDTRWTCRWITPTGRLIAKTTAPSHPFVIKQYALVDGEIHPFIEDVIDQQRYVNRLITLIDNIMGTSAKGVLMFPDDQMSPLMDWQEVSQRWAATDGVILYRPKGDHKPSQVYAHNNDIGAYNLLSLQMKLFDEVSGVGSALQGKEIPSNMSADLYRQQVENSAISLLDLMHSFRAFISDRNARLLAVHRPTIAPAPPFLPRLPDSSRLPPPDDS